MTVRVPSASLSRWGRHGSSLALSALLYAGCTSSEDTEPHVPAMSGASQPEPGGSLLTEEDACDRLRTAAQSAYDRLGCEATFADCPAFLRPGAGSGCYEYSEGSIEACEAAYDDASSCRNLSPCIATAQVNLELATCDQLPSGTGGAPAGGAGPVVGGAGGEAPVAVAGMPGGGGAPAQGGDGPGGASAGGAAN